MMFDVTQVVLHREFGFGYDRMLKFSNALNEYYAHYYIAIDSRDPSAEELREYLDRELLDVVKDRQEIKRFEERYPWIKPIDYTRPRKPHEKIHPKAKRK